MDSKTKPPTPGLHQVGEIAVDGRRLWVRDGAELPAVCLACGRTSDLVRRSYHLRNSERRFGFRLCSQHARQQLVLGRWIIACYVAAVLLMFLSLVWSNSPGVFYLIQAIGLGLIGIARFGLIRGVRFFYLAGKKGECFGVNGLASEVLRQVENMRSNQRGQETVMKQ